MSLSPSVCLSGPALPGLVCLCLVCLSGMTVWSVCLVCLSGLSVWSVCRVCLYRHCAELSSTVYYWTFIYLYLNFCLQLVFVNNKIFVYSWIFIYNWTLCHFISESSHLLSNFQSLLFHFITSIMLIVKAFIVLSIATSITIFLICTYFFFFHSFFILFDDSTWLDPLDSSGVCL